MILPRKAVERLHEYVPPAEGRARMLRLDLNENTLGCAPAVATALQRALRPGLLACYPEYQAARAALARYFRVSPGELLITNGVDDAIKLICDTLVEPGDELLTLAPTFPYYQFFHELAGGKVRFAGYDEALQPPVERLLSSLNPRTRWVALANPNNPTGTLIPKAGLRAILEFAPHTLVLVDEAYLDFSGTTILPWIRRYPNLVVGRTFSKAFGLAALRIGFLFAHQRLAELLRRAHAVYAVNGVAIAAAMEAIRHEDDVRSYSRAVREAREEFCGRLAAMGIAYVPSAANFVLLRAGRRAAKIARCLRARNILVRNWNDAPELAGYLRITIGTAAQMRRTAREIRRCLPLWETAGPGNHFRPWRELAQCASLRAVAKRRRIPAESFP